VLALWRRLKPYALLTLLALPALWPSAGPGIPRTNDNLTHLFRTVELDQLLRAGILLPRWAPHLVFGFGYPIFDFFPYGAHDLVEALHLLGLNLVTAYNLAGALVLLASGLFAFRLGREHFGETAGLVAGVAYLYSPYLLYDNYVRGSLPESLALALLPLALLYLRRAVRGDRAAVAWAGLALGAAIFAHHGVMLQAMPFVGLYALWEFASWKLVTGIWRLNAATALRQLLVTNYQLLIVPFLIALATSAFFWLPALTEARYIQTARGTGNGPMNYAGNFLGLDQLFAVPRLPVDPDLLNPPVVHSLPIAALVLAGLALARWARPAARPRPPSLVNCVFQRRRHSRHTIHPSNRQTYLGRTAPLAVDPLPLAPVGASVAVCGVGGRGAIFARATVDWFARRATKVDRRRTDRASLRRSSFIFHSSHLATTGRAPGLGGSFILHPYLPSRSAAHHLRPPLRHAPASGRAGQPHPGRSNGL
jgi:Dolichyl-phosphate-mannose-protein mannosyltransferase